MLPNASHFSINDGTFTEIHSENVNLSKHYHLYIFGDLQNEIEKGLRPPLDEARLKQLVTSVEALLPKPEEGQEANQDVAQTVPSDDQEVEQPGPEPQPEQETIPTLRQLVIYTNTDNANKKLKRATNVVLPLRLPDYRRQGSLGPPSCGRLFRSCRLP